MCDIQDGESRCHLGKSIRGGLEVGVVVLERAAELLWSSWNNDEEFRCNKNSEDTRIVVTCVAGSNFGLAT
jgi:hypothetical protein